MSVLQDGFGASMAKVGVLTTGSLMTVVYNFPYGIVTSVLTMLYAASLLFRALPWMTVYWRAIWLGVFHHDWSHWWKLAGKDDPNESDEIPTNVHDNS